jgi:tetratricopeptide (TPR) repeat protein
VLTSAAAIDRLRVPRRAGRGLAGVAALILIGAAVGFGPSLASKAWHSFTRTPLQQTSADPTARLTSLSGTRYPLWKVALKAFDAHPLDGIGAGTTEFWWNEHATDDEFVRDAHSIWIQNLEELGAPGFLLILAVAASALGLGIAVRRRVRRTASAGAAAAFLAVFLVYLLHASVDWMWESTAVTVLALAGIAVLGARLGAARPRLRAPARVVLVVLALAGGIIQLPGLLSTAAIRRSQAAERAQRPELALGWAQNAVDAEPWSASAYEQLGLVLESAGQLRAAATDLQRAISREPQNYEHWLVLARIETELGRLGPAVRDYDRARQLRPRSSVFTPVSSAGSP